jgi:hypothetical protein
VVNVIPALVPVTELVITRFGTSLCSVLNVILIAAGRWWKKEEEKEKQKQKQNHETPSQIKATRKKSNRDK